MYRLIIFTRLAINLLGIAMTLPIAVICLIALYYVFNMKDILGIIGFMLMSFYFGFLLPLWLGSNIYEIFKPKAINDKSSN